MDSLPERLLDAIRSESPRSNDVADGYVNLDGIRVSSGASLELLTLMPTIHLIDASPYIFRAFHSLPSSIRDKEGKPANAIYGFTSFLIKYLAEEKPTHIGVTFDQNFNRSFRNKFYPPYKAHRPDAPAEIEAQNRPCLEVASAMGMAVFIDPDYEADDLIATIIDQTATTGSDYVIVTSDKDLSQLVDDHVTVYDFAKHARLDASAVEAKFGVRPDQITDFLGLAGDAVDNIPGVRGIGPKTAAQLLRRYGSLEGIYENLSAMEASRARGAGTTAAKLTADVTHAGLSKRLATVARDAPIRTSLEELEYRGPDETLAAALFDRLGFKTLRVAARANQ